ncbi:hypothetical protein F2Q69_00008396 [Brassica cretica]|uniref:Uncharacterized protein n=1 Tax=Brassica cretica TaxID=69181 RepID=A0A8S9NRP4_BRACR|nr:hypothetical protein F2Q69_00008396 [Brassica cretica]
MKSLGEFAQLNYGAPRRRIRSNRVQMWELCNLQLRNYPAFLSGDLHPWPALTLASSPSPPLKVAGYVTLSWCLKLEDEISIGRLTLSARWCDLFLIVKELVDG